MALEIPNEPLLSVVVPNAITTVNLYRHRRKNTEPNTMLQQRLLSYQLVRVPEQTVAQNVL
jgi:hypothetical protein